MKAVFSTREPVLPPSSIRSRHAHATAAGALPYPAQPGQGGGYDGPVARGGLEPYSSFGSN